HRLPGCPRRRRRTHTRRAPPTHPARAVHAAPPGRTKPDRTPQPGNRIAPPAGSGKGGVWAPRRCPGPPETMNPERSRILGTSQALHADGTVVPVGGARLRALLTVLALRAGRTVPVGTLVDEVWDGDPPADATGALQALVGRLRRTLGADTVASADGGYRLTAAPDDVRSEEHTSELQ